MFTAIIFIVVLSVLVLAHELGHFWAARRAGMRVEEFGFGFPPRLFRFKKGDTVYSINLIPFGGFVKILGEDGNNQDSPESFISKKAGTRSLVLAAGVLMNILLTVILLSIGNFSGLRIGLADGQGAGASDIKVQIVEVVTGGPAEVAGIRIFDEIINATAGGSTQNVTDIAEFQKLINENRGQEVNLKIARGGKVFDYQIIPRLNPPPGQGALGISLARTGVVKSPWYLAIPNAARDTFLMLTALISGYIGIIKNIFLTGKAGIEVTGPIGIAVITGQAARQGWVFLIQLTAWISINLAVINSLPFPALDGGRLLFVLIEKLKGSPVPRKLEASINAAGFAFLLALMVIITAKDLIKFF